MPTYSFIDTLSGEEFDSFMKISEREEYLKENPHIQTVLTTPAIVSGVVGTGSLKVPDGFKEVLSKVSEKHRGSPLAERYGKKSIREAKNSEVVKKHVERVTKRLQGR